MDQHSNLPSQLGEALDVLAENLLASEPFNQARLATSRLQADAEASQLWRRLAQLETHVRQMQANGGLSASDIRDYRAAQAESQANAQIGGYLQAQQAVQIYLQEINQEISEALGVDFATLARRSSC